MGVVVPEEGVLPGILREEATGLKPCKHESSPSCLGRMALEEWECSVELPSISLNRALLSLVLHMHPVNLGRHAHFFLEPVNRIQIFLDLFEGFTSLPTTVHDTGRTSSLHN